MIKNLLLSFVFIFNIFADIANSKDPEGVKRYADSEIIRYEQLSFNKYQVPLGKMLKFDFGTKQAEFEQSENLEGQVTRISYRIPDPLRSSLEVYRNYESDLTNSGWSITYRASGKAEYGNAFTHIYELLKGHDQLFTYNDADGHFLVAKKADSGLTICLFVTKFEYGLTGNTSVKKGEPIVQLDFIKTKVMEDKMVLLKSSEMAKSISDAGKVSLYGIFFDFNKSDIKPESVETLNEISKLLNEKPNLKLLVVGHTDNVGDFEFNRALSQRRAASVVTYLTEKGQIASQRLASFGASFAAPLASNETEPGKAKNRRVELVAMN